jgi:hypothetical protein
LTQDDLGLFLGAPFAFKMPLAFKVLYGVGETLQEELETGE